MSWRCALISGVIEHINIMLRKNKVVRKAVVTGTLCGLLYLSMSRQGLSDIYGVAKSLLNTSRAGIILAQSVYDYSH